MTDVTDHVYRHRIQTIIVQMTNDPDRPGLQTTENMDHHRLETADDIGHCGLPTTGDRDCPGLQMTWTVTDWR